MAPPKKNPRPPFELFFDSHLFVKFSSDSAKVKIRWSGDSETPASKFLYFCWCWASFRRSQPSQLRLENSAHSPVQWSFCRPRRPVLPDRGIAFRANLTHAAAAAPAAAAAAAAPRHHSFFCPYTLSVDEGQPLSPVLWLKFTKNIKVREKEKKLKYFFIKKIDKNIFWS